MGDQNVINLQSYFKAERPSACAQLDAYWESLRGSAPLPQRSQIDPRGIERALKNAFILETIAPGYAKLRVAGLRLNELMGMEVRGMPLSCFIEPSGRDDFSNLLRRVVTTPAKLSLTLYSRSARQQSRKCGEMILLPLLDAHGNITRLLGGLETELGQMKAPVRFTPAQARFTEIEGQGRPSERGQSMIRAFEPPQMHTPAAQGAGAFLTLVSSRD